MEEGLLSAILASPEDEALRLVYADWLEERGDTRAAFLRAEVALAAAPADDLRRAGLQARLQEAGARISPAWPAAVSRVPIENCGVEFRFRCPQR